MVKSSDLLAWDSYLHDASWKKHLLKEFEAPYMRELHSFIQSELKNRVRVYPDIKNIFAAYNSCPLQKVRIVILGQDPYHGEGQAHGLAFSVCPEVKIPPSLRNIYKELNADIGFSIPKHGHLQSWAEQGVFLLNTVLTVRQANAGSHRKKGWEKFTDKTIQILNQQDSPIVFLLWGSPAAEKEKLLNNPKHLILKAPHPSPLSAHRGFLGCKHFSQANNFLQAARQRPINWQI